MVPLRQAFQSQVERDDFVELLQGKNHRRISRDMNCSSTPLGAILLSRMINQNATHYLGCHGKKMRATAP